MTILGDSNNVYKVDCSRGIEGSTGINAIPDGFCLELENASLAQRGVISKRVGYNMWGCELPVRCRKSTVNLAAVAPTPMYTLQMDSTPIMTLECTVYKNSLGKINELVPEYYNSLENTFTHTFICVFTNLPSDILITLDSLFEMSDGTFISPVFVANRTTVFFGVSNLAKFNVVGYLDTTAPFSQVIATAYRPLLHSGVSLESVYNDSYSISNPLTSTTLTLAASSLSAQILSIGDGVYFESNAYLGNIGGNSIYGIVSKISGVSVTVLFENVFAVAVKVELALQNFLRIRIIRGRALTLLSGPANVTANIKHISQFYDYQNHSTQDEIINFTSFQTAIRPLGPNSLIFKDTVNFEGVMYLYGSRISAGYVGMVNKYFNRDTNIETLITEVNGNLFEETDNDISFGTIKVPQITADANPVTDINSRLTLTITGAEKVYLATDIVFRNSFDFLTNSEVEVSFVVYSVSTDTLVLTTNYAPNTSFPVKVGQRFKIRRTSNKIFTNSTQTGGASPDGNDIEEHKIVPGMSIQVGNSGKDYNSYTVEYVNRTDFSVDADAKYHNYITINDTITWESDSTVYLNPMWYPIFFGTAGAYEYAPLTSSQFDKNSKDLSSASYDYALYIASGVDGIWRYDGQSLSNLRLPAPPLAYWRNLPNSSGFLPTKTGENGKDIGTKVIIRLTYIYTDTYGRVYESPVSPNSDITVTSEPLNDGSGKARLIEVRVPSIPINSGFPADKIRIRAYRNMIDVANGDEFVGLDTEVENSFNSPFTSLVVGKVAPSFSIDLDELYASYAVTGSNRPAPLADYLAVLNNKLVALGGFELPIFEMVARQVFENSSVDGSPFFAYSLLEHTPIISSEKPIRFFTVPMAYKINTKEKYAAADITDYPGTYPTFTTSTMITNSADGEFVIDTASGKGITYTDVSSRFKLKPSAAVNMTLAVSTTRIKLRTIGVDVVSDIDFNGDVFSGLVDAVPANDELFLTATTKWINQNPVSLLGTDATKVAVFEQMLSITENIGFGSSAGVASKAGGVRIVSNTANDPRMIELWVDTLNTYTHLLNTDFIVIQMNKRSVDGTFDDDSLGNIIADGSKDKLLFNSQIIFRVTTVTIADTDGYDKYQLQVVNLKSDLTNYDALKVNATANVTTDGAHGAFEVFKLTNTTALPVLKTSGTDSFTSPSTTVKIYLTAAPTAIVSGTTYVSFNFQNGTGLTNIDFASLGFPNLNGSFKVTNKDNATKWIEIDTVTYPLKVAPNPTLIGDTYGGYVIDPAKYVDVDLVNKELTVKYSDNLTVTAGDWHFLVFRNWEFNSLSSQISGWFKVKTSNVIASPTVVYYYNESTYDLSLNTGFKLSKMITGGSDVDRLYIPIPVPYKKGLSEELFDLVWPMFEQRSDAVITPLMGVSKRYALALNAVLNNKGFANWGGMVDETTLYPVNGFQFTSHVYPVNRYRSFQNSTYTRPTISLSQYSEPFDYFTFTANKDNYYSLFGGIKTPTDSVYNTKRLFSTAGVANKITYTTPATGSRIWWTTYKSGQEINNQITVFKYALQDEISSPDGEDIVGAAPYQNFLVVAKNNSLYRTTLDVIGEKIEIEKAQSTVGAVSGKNMIPTEAYMYFVHTSGVYFLNGMNVEPETTLNRYFENRVYQNAQLLPFTAGYHDQLQKEVVIGVPYSSSDTATTDIIDGQFVHNYNEGVMGWSVNTNIPATQWIRRLNENYFSSIDGRVYKKRSERAVTRYRDYEDPITFKLRTRYVNMGDDINFKFIRNFILQLGTETDMNVTVNYTWDYFKDTKPLTIIPLSSDSYRGSPYAGAYFVSNKYLKPVRGMVEPNRVAQLGLEIINAEIDAKMEVYSINIEGQLTNTKLVTQKNQRR